MSCIGDAYCPECHEIIYGNGCMCGLTCDRGTPRHRCMMDAPDGIHPRRMYGQPHPNQLMETRNGWTVGWTLTMDGPWQRSEPYHPTKSPSEVRMEEVFGRPTQATWVPVVGLARLTQALVAEGVLDGGGI